MVNARTVSTLFALAGAVSCFVVGACSATSRDSLEGPKQEFELDSGTVDVAPEPRCHLQCSGDLKSVLRSCEGDERETVAETCGEGLACGDGRCVDPCLAAELSKGSIGCSFYTLPPEEAMRQTPSCFAAFIANTWEKPVHVTAEFGGEPLDISRAVYSAKKVDSGITYTPLTDGIPPGGVAIVFLSQGTPNTLSTSEFLACPVEPALLEDPLKHGTAIERAIHLKTDAPISAYSIYPYGGAASHVPAATLLLPVSAWETNYLAVTAAGVRMAGGSSPYEVIAPTSLQIIAAEDDTEVRILPKADISDGEGVQGTAAGQPRAYKLSKGQVLQLAQRGELTGSAIEATKRIGLFGGSECTYLPSTSSACDFLHQQIPPLSQWGSEYVLAPYPTRIPAAGGAEIRERVLWRFVGAANGTKLTYDPARPVGAPETLEAGEAKTFLTDAIVSVASQDTEHPFYAGVYMTASSFYGTTGDPDYVNVVPAAQFLDRYVFFTDHTYPETGLTIVRRKTSSGFQPVELECAGPIAGFQPIGKDGEYEFAWVHLNISGKAEMFPKGLCDYGRHEAKSEGPFSVTVWGTGPYASYGYAGGSGSRPLNPATAPVPR